MVPCASFVVQREVFCESCVVQSCTGASFVVQSGTVKCFVLQSLHRVLPSTTLYYKACTKHFPVLLCTTKLAQNISMYYFVTTKLAQSNSRYYFVLQELQSLHKAGPSTTLYYKACTSTSQYYFVLESLHKVLPSTTLYHKAYTEYFPVQSLHKVLPSTTFLVQAL